MARRIDPAGLVVGAALLLVAGVLVYDAQRLPPSTYGLGPAAMPHVVAIGLVALAVGNVVSAWTGGMPAREPADASAILLILGGLVALIVIIGAGGGFIPAIAVLFAATATAMGRRRIAADLAIGLALGLGVYLMFAKLLALSLPTGPLENLL